MSNIYTFETQKKRQNRGLKSGLSRYVSLTPDKTPIEDNKPQISNLRKRAKSKWYTQKVVGSLLYTNSELHKYYQRAWYCNNILTQENGKIRGTYCNTRVCNVCNRIRTAKLINGYLSQLKGRDLQFVTLTIPNVSGKVLRSTVNEMIHSASNILEVFRRRRKQPLNGIRKLEVTYNSWTDMYHPHFHLLVDGQGEKVVNEWLQRYPDAVRDAQDCKPVANYACKGEAASMKELFKYTTKIIMPKEDKAGKTGDVFMVYVKAIDTIMCALSRKRTFQPFGDIIRISEDVDEDLEAEETDSYESIQWIWHEAGDWYDENTGELLTGFEAPDKKFVYK